MRAVARAIVAYVEAHLFYDLIYRRNVIVRVVEYYVIYPTLVDVGLLQLLSYHLSDSLVTENLQTAAGQ